MLFCLPAVALAKEGGVSDFRMIDIVQSPLVGGAKIMVREGSLQYIEPILAGYCVKIFSIFFKLLIISILWEKIFLIFFTIFEISLKLLDSWLKRACNS